MAMNSLRKEDYCGAYQQYTNAMTLGNLDQTSQANYNDAFTGCYPATPTVVIPTATEVPTATDVPTVASLNDHTSFMGHSADLLASHAGNSHMDRKPCGH